MIYKIFLNSLCVLAVVFLASCAGNYSSAEKAAWKNYLRSSPFSYSTSDSIKVVNLLKSELRRMPPSGNVTVDRHVSAVLRWTEDYPAYYVPAMEAKRSAYREGKEWEGLSQAGGGYVGREMADDDWFSKKVGGTIGELLGAYANELYSQSAGNAAFRRVMAPLIERGRALSYEEHRINVLFDLPTTPHLRAIISR